MMKRVYFLLSFVAFAINAIHAQSWNSGVNALYVLPDTTKVGIGISNPLERLHVNNGALKIGNSTSSSARNINVLKFGDGDYVKIGEWETDDMLSLKATKYNFTSGNVGLGVSSPQYKLDVNGKVFLRSYDSSDGWSNSYLLWEAHKLILGTPTGTYAHNFMELIPGGSSQGEIFSQISLYHAHNQTQKEEVIRFCTSRDSWINTTANMGIGTSEPLYKLDVRGTIRADEIVVNNVSGADFVFDNSYQLCPLSEIKEYVQKNHHLPDIPSAQEMRQNGVNMTELQIQLLRKIEELTLYIIQQDQLIKELEVKINQ